MLSEPALNFTSIIPGSCSGALPWERAPATAAHFIAGSAGAAAAGQQAWTHAQLPGPPAQAGTDTAPAWKTGRKSTQTHWFSGVSPAAPSTSRSAPAPSRSSHRHLPSIQPGGYRAGAGKCRCSRRGSEGLSSFQSLWIPQREILISEELWQSQDSPCALRCLPLPTPERREGEKNPALLKRVAEHHPAFPSEIQTRSKHAVPGAPHSQPCKEPPGSSSQPRVTSSAAFSHHEGEAGEGAWQPH